MTLCRPICVSTISGTNREKWDYVRTFYYGSRTEIRAIDDEARIADEARWATEFGEDEAAWIANYSHVPFERFLQWKFEQGTYQYGNLGDWKKDDHVGHCFAPCPYDSNADETRTRIMLDLSNSDPLPTRNDHGIYYMKTANRGAKWGFECTSDSCPYYTTNGVRYFYT